MTQILEEKPNLDSLYTFRDEQRREDFEHEALPETQIEQDAEAIAESLLKEAEQLKLMGERGLEGINADSGLDNNTAAAVAQKLNIHGRLKIIAQAGKNLAIEYKNKVTSVATRSADVIRREVLFRQEHSKYIGLHHRINREGTGELSHLEFMEQQIPTDELMDDMRSYKRNKLSSAVLNKQFFRNNESPLLEHDALDLEFYLSVTAYWRVKTSLERGDLETAIKVGHLMTDEHGNVDLGKDYHLPDMLKKMIVLLKQKGETGSTVNQDSGRMLEEVFTQLDTSTDEKGNFVSVEHDNLLNYAPALISALHKGAEQSDEVRLTSLNNLREKVITTLLNGNVGELDQTLKITHELLALTDDEATRKAIFENIFNSAVTRVNYHGLLRERDDLPYTQEQKAILELLDRIYNSPSKTIKNLGGELAMSLVRGADTNSLTLLEERYNRIEDIFVKNNIPFIGKQFKVFQAMYPKYKFENSLKDISSPELLSLHSDNARRLLIFKDLLKINFTSLNPDLEAYLNVLQEGKKVLEKYEAKSEELTEDEKQQLQYFLKKINTLAENTHNPAQLEEVDFNSANFDTTIESLRKNFGVKPGQTIIEKFDQTFLKRAGIDNLDEATNYYENLRHETDQRNRDFVADGRVSLKKDDLAKGVAVQFFDQLLNKGVYSPEFIGADTIEAKKVSESSDATPWDTDVLRVGNRSVKNICERSDASKYGEVVLIVRNRGQFNATEHKKPVTHQEGKLELFLTGVIDKKDHLGIRTGFGSTEIDAILVKDALVGNEKELDGLKFSIARKGFYIPLCNSSGKVIFSPEEFDEYRKIFRGIGVYHGEQFAVHEQNDSKHATEIQEFTQSKENLAKIEKVRDSLYSDIETILQTSGMQLHRGKYEDNIRGAQISDTGSTGRGSALDDGYDFDFVIKVDDSDFEKVPQIITDLNGKYHLDSEYEKDGMRTCRFKNVKVGSELAEVDISFVKKSESEDLDANETTRQQYESIKETQGEEKLLQVLTNVRFAKAKLKEAECYKKGAERGIGQQGGMGGIGVETWVLKNNGDAIAAFREFYNYAYKNGSLVSFNEFKKRYKIFGAGENIRGGVKAENFINNMDDTGYKNMAKLAGRIVELA